MVGYLKPWVWLGMYHSGLGTLLSTYNVMFKEWEFDFYETVAISISSWMCAKQATYVI